MPTAKIRFQLAPAIATSETLYQVPVITTAKVAIIVTNRSSVLARFNLANRAVGVVLINKHYIAFEREIQGNETLILITQLELLASDLIEVNCNSANVSFQLYGEETT